jgi:hypothetical protein
MAELARFSLKLKEQPVLITGADGADRTFTIREMSGSQAEIYLDVLRDRLIFDTGPDGEFKVKGVKGFAGAYESLLSMCLYDQDGKLVSLEAIQLFPSDALKGLFNIAQTMNALNMEGEAEVKKA